MSTCFQSSGRDSPLSTSVSRGKHSGKRNSQEQIPGLQMPSPAWHLVVLPCDTLFVVKFLCRHKRVSNGHYRGSQEGTHTSVTKRCSRKPGVTAAPPQIQIVTPFVVPALPLPAKLTSVSIVMHQEVRILGTTAGKTSRSSPPFLCQGWNSRSPPEPFLVSPQLKMPWA